MADSILQERLLEIESLLVQGQGELAFETLQHMAEDAEEYIQANCVTTEDTQYFSFPTLFDRLLYRRVENDPRQLKDVGEPLDRLYSDYALAAIVVGDYECAQAALAQAIRWNPMACEYRLNLADLYFQAGDVQEYLALSFSVFERASVPEHLCRAFANFSEFFEVQQKPKVAAACLRAARLFEVEESKLSARLKLAAGTEMDPDSITDAEMRELLAQEGLPDGANAEVAICMLFCAQDSAQAGDRNEATRLTVAARDLVGQDSVKALLELINKDDDGN